MEKDSWILAHVEDSCVSWWDAGGLWHTEGREEYIRNGSDLEAMCEMTPEIEAKMEAGGVFRVLFTDVSFVSEDGYWDLDYGYVFPEAHIEDGGYRIVDAEFEMRIEDGHAGDGEQAVGVTL